MSKGDQSGCSYANGPRKDVEIFGITTSAAISVKLRFHFLHRKGASANRHQSADSNVSMGTGNANKITTKFVSSKQKARERCVFVYICCFLTRLFVAMIEFVFIYYEYIFSVIVFAYESDI